MSINLASNDAIRSARSSRRRSFLKLMTASFIGAGDGLSVSVVPPEQRQINSSHFGRPRRY
jgi:hypothetical protein